MVEITKNLENPAQQEIPRRFMAQLTETRSIDDQIEWLDDSHVLYGTFRSSRSAVVDVSVASIDGNAPPVVFLPAAESPIVVR